ncbi:multidrug and toxin extrusion protein 1-like [Betta splendens]|uniref:Multidrug and toxin extrusion protein n=1 Tax=Betta splendens TaxID=158456 RepID=A0A6P7M9X1_BETSP|nr:multidrug and toxin extrusion protein 1-like [Betta splendens]
MEAAPPVNNADAVMGDVKDDTAPTAVCSRWGLHLSNVLPPNYRDELAQVLKIAVPVILSQVMAYMITTVSMIFCGHLGTNEFAGVSLAIAVLNVMAISVGIGLSLTCDTLVSQTYGSGNLKRVGVILQRGVLILLLACFPCWAVLINTEPLLLAVRQNPEVARVSQLYVKIFMPALPAAFLYQLQGKYLQNQGIVWPPVITGAIGNVLNIIINYIFLFPLDMGVAGSAAANVISRYVLAVALFIYIYSRGLHKATWGGWSLDCLQEWGTFVKLAVPCLLMMCLKWWLLEVAAFLAGIISEAELGAHAIIYQLNMIAFMFPLGFTAAAGQRVGTALGSGNVAQAKLSCKVSTICAFILCSIVGIVFTLARHEIGCIFTKAQNIVLRVSEVMVTFFFMHVADGTAVVIGGVLRGTGKQFVGALCNLVGYYFIGFPIGVSLMFAKKMGILGLWIGLTICAILQLVFFIAYLFKLNWIKAAEEALVRAGVRVHANETVQMDNMGSSQTPDQSSAAPPQGDNAQEGQAQPELPMPPNPGQTVSTTTTVGADNPDQTVSTTTTVGADNPDQTVSTTTTVGVVLPVKQLILRRGLTLLLMVGILVAGVLLSDFLTHLQK